MISEKFQVALAAKLLQNAGYTVRRADMPGLYDVDFIARDVTFNQLLQIAETHGDPLPRGGEWSFKPKVGSTFSGPES